MVAQGDDGRQNSGVKFKTTAAMFIVDGIGTNVALHKPAVMSSSLDMNHPASRAVDGNTRSDHDRYVVHTKPGETSAWWKVDLQTQVQSALVILYFRTDYKWRRNGIQLYTSLQNSNDAHQPRLCHTIIGDANGTDIPDIYSVTCSESWRYLTVYTETNNDGQGAILDFAEVQVWVNATCANEKYGTNCGQECASRHCKQGSDICDPVIGICRSGCQSAWTGISCHECVASGRYGDNCGKFCNSRHCLSTSNCDAANGACSRNQCQTGWSGIDCATCASGLYGNNCNKNCSSRHCLNPMESCASDTGACSNSECQTGWAGTDCTACAPEYYGAGCGQLCAERHCKVDSSCDDKMQGQCVGGCADGYQGTDCTQECTDVMYGPNCARNCSVRHCKQPSSICDRVTGMCPDGCDDGWTGIDCSRNCPDSYYGNNCSLKCDDRHCNSTSCLGDGACSAECEAGWTLRDCTQECPRGTYGINCNSTCGHCASNSTCDHVTGSCHDGCEAGWQRGLCQKGCDNGTFGLSCVSDCGHCNGTCDAIDGRCLWGCAEGYNGSHCSVKLSLLNGQDRSEFPVSAVVGTVAGLLVAIIVIVVVVLVRRRRQRFHDGDINKEDAEFHPKAQENGTYENVALDERRAVNQKPQIKPKPATPASSGKQRYSKDKDQEEEDCNEDVQSPDNCYYNAEADAAIRDVAVSELAATVATLKERKDGFEKEYNRLPAGFTAPYQDSQKSENSGKNKFKGYYPYDHNRVRLTPLPDTPGSDYINASLMHSYNQRKTYIASQAPNKKTVGDFWRMIWEHSCSAVVMLTGLVEESRIKCERYWPTGGVMDIGLFKIEVEVTQSRANFTTRHMKVTSKTTGECRSLVQFHFTSWPDHGVPDTLALVNYIWLVRQTVAETDGPLLVHCSAGIGRTGTYIAVDSLVDQAQGEGVVDVLGYVSVMRGQRKNMIQTPAQYECVFLCLVEMTKYGCTSMDVSNYTNSYSCSGMDTTMDGKTFRQLSEMLVSEAREDAPTRHRMWVDGNPDFIVRVGPSLTCLRGYLQATAPPPGLVKLLWKLVEENDVHNIIVVTPDMGLVQAEGRSKTYGEITVTTTSQTSLSTDVTMNNLQLATKAGGPRQVKMVDVNAHLTMEVMTSHLLNHAQLQEASTQPHPVVVVHSDNDRKLAVSFCIMGNILSGIREDSRVDVVGHVRTFLRCSPGLQFTQSDVQMFHDFAQQCILRTDPANTYANI
ncbi:receptor-type tyrosine-protein phosphatase alpha-like [Haliotis cracherodii]|uniref:receptor-type tyrosine-protein phosphatase alpha-like n=1 Tax=Haliotis cracherodii TaxID=6455 RepID=UPI0039EA1D27